jgi:hypothetical protein
MGGLLCDLGACHIMNKCGGGKIMEGGKGGDNDNSKEVLS